MIQRKGSSTATVLHSDIQRFDVEPRYSDAVRYKDIVFTSGQVSSGDGDILKQTTEGIQYLSTFSGMKCLFCIHSSIGERGEGSKYRWER